MINNTEKLPREKLIKIRAFISGMKTKGWPNEFIIRQVHKKFGVKISGIRVK